MPQAANIVLADALATPVNHTFVPIGPDQSDSSIFVYEDQSQASAAGFWRLTVQTIRPPVAKPGQDTSNRNIKVRVNLYEPTLEVPVTATYSGIAPAPRVSYTNKAFVEFILPERSSLQNRKDLRKMIALALADTQVVSLVETLQTIY